MVYNIGRFIDEVAIPAAFTVLILCGAFTLCAIGVYVLSFV